MENLLDYLEFYKDDNDVAKLTEELAPLAKLFSETSKDNQLIIETHSENLLYGLLKEIRDKKINKDEIKVIYVYMENGESKIDELELNDKGGFKSKWRDGFFTEKLDLL